MKNRFGTTSEMIIQPVEENGAAYLLAIDNKGLYLTTQSHLDSRLADPNRYAAARLNVNERLTALGLDPETLSAENQHRIRAGVGETRRVNPLKASKRASKAKST